MNIAIYARVSTTDKQNVENQLSILREWSQRLGAKEVFEYIDKASGSKADRPQLLKLQKQCVKKKISVVLVWALDRLSREGISRMAGYLEQFKGKGIRVLSHEEPWLDTKGPVSELLIAIFAWVAQQERARFSERIKAGLVTARAKGKKIGRPERKFDRDKALKLRAQGKSIRAVAQELHVPHPTIQRLLDSEKI